MAVTDEEIIRRLRAFKGTGTNLSRTAANRIERLRAELAELRAEPALDAEYERKCAEFLRTAGQGPR